jgi:ribosomal subunit interface protein
MSTLKISAHGFELTDAIRETAEEKFNKVLSRDKDIDNLDVVLEEGSKHGLKTFVVKANLNFHKHHIHVENESSDLYTSIKDVEQKLLREIRKEHRKFRSDRRHADSN